MSNSTSRPPAQSGYLLRTLETSVKKAGVGKAGAHTTRHSAATAWLESGEHIKTVSDLLGHSSVNMTGDIYMQVSPATARAAVTNLGNALGV
ncbi:MAG: tyrosine-type recombinase/integrase [Mycobacterium sp.]|nr:tyrosine-type recombinase/integrase [Mycobacterium sp.]